MVPRFPSLRPVVIALLLSPCFSTPAPAQDTLGTPITNEGVARASALVDAVFIDRTAKEVSVEGGDWASYLMARLGVHPIPPGLNIRVAVDTSGILLLGRVADLPSEAQASLGPLIALLDPSTPIAADIGLSEAGPLAVRFRLRSASIADVEVPEVLLQSAMADVGRRYPVLTASGRDLLVEVPPGSHVTLQAGAVHLSGP